MSDFSHKLNKSLQKSKHISERKEALHSKYTIPGTLWEIPAAWVETQLYLHSFQEGFWRGMVWSFIGNYEEIKHGCQNHKSRKNLHDNARSAVLFNGNSGDCLGTTVGVRKGRLFSTILFSIFPERIIYEELVDHEGSVSFWERLITNFRFTDGITAMQKRKKNRCPGRTSQYNYNKKRNWDCSRQDQTEY